MGLIQEIRELLEKIKFCEIVDEGQVGLYLHNGVVTPRRIRYPKDKLAEIVAKEEKAIQECGGYKHFIPLRKPPILPEGFRRSWVTGLPKHEDRYKTEKDLSAGFYFLWPLVDSLYTDHNQERALFSKPENMVIVPTSDRMNVCLGYVMTLKIANYNRAYTKGDDYEDLLRAEASSIVAKLSVGKSSENWTVPEVYKGLADETLSKLNKFTNNKWGVSVEKFALTPIILNPNILVVFGSGQQSGVYVSNEAMRKTASRI